MIQLHQKACYCSYITLVAHLSPKMLHPEKHYLLVPNGKKAEEMGNYVLSFVYCTTVRNNTIRYCKAGYLLLMHFLISTVAI